MATGTKPFELIIRGATVFDGSGSAGVRADVGVRGERIAAIEADLLGDAGREIDAHGLALAPGFIDVHSHDDFAVLIQPEMPFKVLQGVTTDIVGNCGSAWCRSKRDSSGFGGCIRMRTPNRGTASLSIWCAYRRLAQRSTSRCSSATAHSAGAQWNLTSGRHRRPRLDRMRAWLREGMQAGAVGLSTGLIYDRAVRRHRGDRRSGS